MEYIKIRNWEKWQTYRNDRGQPPWIKVHRRIRLNPEWVELSDSERGQLVAMWLLAADKEGAIPASEKIVQKLCFMSEPPNFNKFTKLGFLENGWRRSDAGTTPIRQPNDQPKAEKRRGEKNRMNAESSDDSPPPSVFISIPLIDKTEYEVTDKEVLEFEELYPAVNIKQKLRDLKGWNISNPKNRKTRGGILKHIHTWLRKEQDKAPRKEEPEPNTNLCKKCHKRPWVKNGLCQKCWEEENK